MFDRHFEGGASSLTVGTTGSGKTYASVWDILLAAIRGDLAIVVLDPHYRSLARLCLQYLAAYINEKRILFDSFSDVERVLPYRVLQGSTGRNEFERRSLNDLKAQHLLDALSRRRDIASLIQNPQTEENVTHAVRLLISQRTPRADADLLYAFWPEHPTFDVLLNNCTDRLTQSFFAAVGNGSIKPGTYASARRLISSVYGNALYEARCGALSGFDVGAFLGKKTKGKCNVLLVEGGGPGVSSLASNSLLALILLQVTSYIRCRPRPYPKVAVWIDEATNANLIGSAGYETRAINELRKFGLDGLHILVQSPDFPNADVERSVLQNCKFHYWHQCSADSVAAKAAADLGSSDLRKILPTLLPGERYTKGKHGRVYRERVPILPDPYGWPGMMEQKAEKVLARIRQRPEFVEPSWESGIDSENATSQHMEVGDRNTDRMPRSGQGGLARFWNWLSRTPSSDSTSSHSSPTDRLRRRDDSAD